MPRRKLTDRQRQMLSILYHYIKDSGYPPTIEEMKNELGVVSNQSVLDFLYHLEEKKFIKRERGVARSVAILPAGYEALGKPPLAAFLGITSAGAPVEAIEIPGEWLPMSAEVSRLEDSVFLLKISGNSMINAGIDDGDIVLVKNQKEFASGDIVLAQTEGEATVKRFISNDKPPFIYLKPENPEQNIIPFTERMELKGKVISVLKNGYWKPVK